MKRSMREKAIAGCLAAALLLLGACGSRSGEDEQEVGSESIGVEETDGTDVETLKKAVADAGYTVTGVN